MATQYRRSRGRLVPATAALKSRLRIVEVAVISGDVSAVLAACGATVVVIAIVKSLILPTLLGLFERRR